METPWVEGSTFDPYNQNVLKGDYPIHGNHTFLNLNLQSASTINPRVVAAGGRREQFFTNQNFVMGAEIFGGTGAFEPKRWAVRVTTVANFNFLANNTLNPFDSLRGNSRLAVEEAFFEKRLKVVGPNFDFLTLRVGMQNFNADFRGFLFADNQLGARLFGTFNSQRDTYNIAFFSMRQRDEVAAVRSSSSLTGSGKTLVTRATPRSSTSPTTTTAAESSATAPRSTSPTPDSTATASGESST
jgi:hypothetical protein